MVTQSPNAANLKGAFLFFRIKTVSRGLVAVVAYDSDIKPGTKLADLQAKYLGGSGANLPYYENFATMSAMTDPVWQGPKSVTYGGIFAGPGTPNKGRYCNAWPFVAAGGPIKDGLYLSYWNYDTSRGMHTSSTTQPFTKDANVPYMWLKKGNSANLVPAGATIIRDVLSEVYLDWYATYDPDYGWDNEKIPA